MTKKELAQYVMGQLLPLGQVRSIPMMGGYLFYYREKIIGGIYGKGFLVKDVPAAREHMPGSVPEPPYDGAKPMLPVTILDDSPALCAMVEAMFPQLPERKPKSRKPKKG